MLLPPDTIPQDAAPSASPAAIHSTRSIVSSKPSINIMGVRGVPGAHGGFETFAEQLALYLVDQGWQVTVYCQADDGALVPAHQPVVDHWRGIERRTFAPRGTGPKATIDFDLACVRDVINRDGVDLVLGYNTAVFNLLQRSKGRHVVMNMDGIEWKRKKWSLPAKAWLLFNELVGLNASSVAIADHPEIARQLSRRSWRKPTMIPYGGHRIDDAPTAPITAMQLEPNGYYLCVCRLEPENSVLEIIRAYRAAPRRHKLIMLGRFDTRNSFHNSLIEAGGDAVIFPGPIYDAGIVSSLRFHTRAYLHGHQVGGTNPSLVESLGAGNAVIAHDNVFNRWTAGDGQFFFGDVAELAALFGRLETDDDALATARIAAIARYERDFRWEDVLGAYERCLLKAGRMHALR